MVVVRLLRWSTFGQSTLALAQLVGLSNTAHAAHSELAGRCHGVTP
jgi:hypothetical protein